MSRPRVAPIEPHGHAHHEHVPAGRVWIALVATLAAAAVELAFSRAGHSLFLTADAVHLLAHLGIFFVLLVRPGEKHGAREDVTTILVLAIVLAIAIAIGVESVDHLVVRPERDVRPLAMVVSLVGLVANLLAAWLFRDPARDRFSFRAALAHELADASLTIVGLAGAGLIAIAGWWWIDPGLSLLIAVWLLVWASRLLVLRRREGPAAWARHA